MKNIKNIVLLLVVLVITIVASGYTKSTSSSEKNSITTTIKNKEKKTANLFVTHGHCSTPFSGIVKDLKLNVATREDIGNPLEGMELSFSIDPNSFKACSGDELTARVKTPGVFIDEKNENITFKSTSVFTMGIDWYQVNGKMSIKGVEKEVKLFITGIRDSNQSMTSELVLQGQMNLFDWGIDYDKLVNGKSENISTKWMFINMKIKTSSISYVNSFSMMTQEMN
jgi:polyisoprenoid-binding protein YceI